MAKFTSNYELEGTLMNQTYYKTRGKSFVKRKGGVSRERILTEKNFARTRENGNEFGASASAGKLLRNSFALLVQESSDSLVTSRLTQVMTKVKNFDTESIRGERSVANGIATDEGKALLDGFNFNKKAILSTVLSKPYQLDTSTGIITISNFIPVKNVNIPEGATNVSFTGALGTIDFASGIFMADYSNEVNLPYDTKSTDVVLTPIALPGGKGVMFYLLQIAFFQEVNGVQYILNNGGYNSLCIIDLQ